MHEFPTGTVTLLFSDMEGSTRLLQQVGERYANVLEASRHLLRTACIEFHGHEVDTQGDAFFVAFIRATDAISAAVEAQRALASHAWPEGVAVRVRMGLHTGEPHLAAEGYVGLDVHRAARIMHAGHGGQILLSQTTRDLVEHELPEGASLRDLGTHRLKDLEHPSHLYQLVTPGLPADFPPLKTLDTHIHNLPIQLTSLIGREQEIAAVEHLLRRQEVRLLTLTGPGGTGKTRLGLQVAAELSGVFSDGVFFVNLAPLSNPELVLPTIALALGLKEAAGQPLLDLVSTWLREKELLLLLDNFEQVAEAAVEVSALLARCPQLNVLVTSRAVLHLSGEHEFPVPPLSLPDPKHLPDLVTLSQYEAVALFIARAQAIKPDFQVTNANAPAVAEICVRLDGLPLAIELAAARSKMLPPQALLARLGQRFTLLTSGAQDVPARHQTLRNTIAWSYDLLDAGEQLLFRRLSVFVGGATPEAIAALSTTLGDKPGQLLDGIASLIDKSLLRQNEQEGEEPRFVMFETIREYGLEALSASGEAEVTCQMHAAYYLALAEKDESFANGPQQEWWFARLEQEHDNLRTALHWLRKQKEAELTLRLSDALSWFWLVRGYLSEGCQQLEQALVESEGAVVSVRERASALNSLGLLLLNQGDYEQAKRRSEESVALWRELGDMVVMAWPLHHVALIEFDRGNFRRARSQLEECLARLSEGGDKAGRAYMLSHLVWIYSEQGEYDKACSCAQESLTLFREVEDSVGICDALCSLVKILVDWQTGKPEVQPLLEEHLALARATGNVNNLAEALHNAGRVAFSQGDLTTAYSFIEESLALGRAQGFRDTTESLVILGQITAAQHDHHAAQAFYEESLALARKLGNKRVLPAGLEGMAALVATQGELTWAARLWGTAEALREAMGSRIPPVYRSDYEHAVATARAQRGEKALAAAWAEGRGMTPEQVLLARGPVTVPTTHPSSLPSEKSPPTYPDGLTAREVEVLCLVAQGLSNAEIAEQLIISLLTVKAHMRSLYNKLGISSRSAATRYAIEHHLL